MRPSPPPLQWRVWLCSFKLGYHAGKCQITGCEACAILSEGILKFIEEDGEVSREDVGEHRVDFNLAGTRRSIEVVLLNTPIVLSFFCSERVSKLSPIPKVNRANSSCRYPLDSGEPPRPASWKRDLLESQQPRINVI